MIVFYILLYPYINVYNLNPYTYSIPEYSYVSLSLLVYLVLNIETTYGTIVIRSLQKSIGVLRLELQLYDYEDQT